MSKHNAEQPHPAHEPARPASLRRLTSLYPAAGIATEQQHQLASAAASAGSSFRSLATVELQLVMQHCDLSTLLALARCSRFTLSAASHPFAWRALSPLSFPTTVVDLGANLRGSRLLAHCDVALRWVPAIKEQPYLAVDDAELAVIDSVPRLVELDTRARKVHFDELRRLLTRPALAGLTALHTEGGQLHGACTALLPLHQPRLRTLSVRIERSDADPRLLAPLPQLPALTDLSLSGIGMDESAVEIIGRCASLRRLHLSCVEPADLFAVLTAPARSRLESLSLSNVAAHALPPDGVATAADRAAANAAYAYTWRVCFENLQSLRSLSLQQCGSLNELLTGAAAALATGSALRSLTALRADTLKMNIADGSLISLLAAHCPQLRRLHVYEIYSDSSYSPGVLGGLPLLSGLSDLRLQCAWQPNGDELAVGRCASLTRLHLSDISSSSLHSILLSPQLQRLEALTLESVRLDRDEDEDAVAQGDLDWSVCFANLQSLRALSLDGCDGGDRLLAALQAACPPLLCSMRFRHSSAHSKPLVVPQLKLLPALLVQLPAFRVELMEETPSPHWETGKKSRQLHALHHAWHTLESQFPDRVTITQMARFDRNPLGTWSD